MRHLSPTLMRLNLDTQAFHAEVDAPWLELTGQMVTRSHYIAQLSRVFGFEGPLEGALAYTTKLASIIDLRRHLRSGLIAQDLLALELSPQQITAIPQCTKIVPISSVSEALGWMYAMERSTLLHELVHRHLDKRLPSIGDACSYISAYANGIAAERWAELGDALELVAISPVSIDDITRAAIAAFECSEEWYRPLQLELMASR
jgi:heme oxygenase